MNINKSYLYLFLLLYLPPLVDSLSGYLILSGGLSDDGSAFTPSQLLRFIQIIFSFYIIRASKKILYLNMFFIVYLVGLELILTLHHQLPHGMIIGITWASKLSLLALTFSSLYVLYLAGRLSFRSLLWHIKNNIVISSLLLIVTSMLSIGFSTYIEGTAGSKGLFASGNGLSVYLGTGLLLVIYLWQINSEKMSYISALVVLVAVLLIGTKSALVFSVIGVILLIVLSHRSLLSAFSVLFVIAVLLVLSEGSLLERFYSMFDVIVYRFDNRVSVSSYIFSGRDVKLDYAINEYNTSGYYLIRVLTGFGAFVSFQDPLVSTPIFITLESDFFELFFMYGLVGLGAYLFMFLSLLNKTRNDKSLALILVVWFSHSIFAGHSLFNGMSGLLLPLLAVLVIMQYRSTPSRRQLD